MKGLVISAVGLFAMVAFGPVRTAAAQTSQRVVVEPFAGPGAPRFRGQINAALARLGRRVVPDEDVAQAAATLKLVQLSDNYGALANELDATLFIGGAILARDRRTTSAQLKFKNAQGVLVGRVSWNGSTVPAVMTKVQNTLLSQLRGILARVPSDPPAVSAGALADTEEAAAPPADPLAAEAPPLNPAPEPEPEPEPVPAAPAPMEAGDPGPPDLETPPGLMARPEGEEEEGPSPVNRFDLSVGTQIYVRTFAYSENRVGLQQDYRVAGVPAPNISFDYFPLPFVGVSLSGEYSVPLDSRDGSGRTYRTGSFGYSVGAKGRLTLGRADIMAGGAFGQNTFTIAKDSRLPNQPQVADVSYSQIKGGASVRVGVGRLVSVIGGANYLHLLGVGELKSYFPYVTGSGGEGYAGVGVRVWSRFEVRATATFRGYVFAMNTQQGDPREARGAVDQYLGLNLAVALRD